MKKFLLIAFAVFISLGAKAQSGYCMVIRQTDGTENYYYQDYGAYITFNNEGITVSQPNTDSGELTLKFSEIAKIYFKTSEGLNDVSGDNVILYPNPTLSSFRIAGADNANVQIYSMDGKMVYNGINNGKEINVSDLEKGIYAVKINGKTLKFSKL